MPGTTLPSASVTFALHPSARGGLHQQSQRKARNATHALGASRQLSTVSKQYSPAPLGIAPAGTTDEQNQSNGCAVQSAPPASPVPQLVASCTQPELQLLGPATQLALDE